MGESIHPSSAPEERTAAQRPGQAPFHAHIELLQFFLAHRDGIVEKIEGLLNAQRKPIDYLQDVPQLSRHFEKCFYTLRGLPRDQSRLGAHLDEAHWASGFRPRKSPGLHNDLVDPAEMMVRAFHLWQQTVWPGGSGRTRYAQTLFNLYVIRRLALLSMRLWDSGDAGPASDEDRPESRPAQIQSVLDQLWRSSPVDQPVLVRDARWLIPVAQSPTTDELAGYFEVAEQIAETLSEGDQAEISKASVRMAGGHLRSQLHHLSIQKGVAMDEHSLVLSNRNSNALDFALLIQGLAPLLDAYEDAPQSGDGKKRLELAATICQGISPDPELFLNRLDLLGPYSMIEHLFVTTDRDGHAVYSHLGERHVQLLHEYEARIRRLSKLLLDDCRNFRPVDGRYSPFGVLYGFSSNLIEHMALKTLQPDALTRFSLEDVFEDGSADKRAWVNGWRKLPHVKQEVARLFEYPQQFAEDIFTRIENALRKRVSDDEANAAAHTGRLFILPGDEGHADSKLLQTPDLPMQYFRSSDREIVAAHKAVPCEQADLLHSRLEGEFVLSYEASGGWVAVTKDVLTEVLGAGRDAKIAGLPQTAAGVLSLMCPDLVVLQDH